MEEVGRNGSGTKLGKMVKGGATDIREVCLGMPVMEPEIIDYLLPDMEEEVMT